MNLAIDVWENEPYGNIELANLSLIATPHIAGHSLEGKLRGTYMVAKAFEEFKKVKLNFTLCDFYYIIKLLKGIIILV